MQYNFTTTRLAEVKSVTVSNFKRDMKQCEYVSNNGRCVSWCNYLEK